VVSLGLINRTENESSLVLVVIIRCADEMNPQKNTVFGSSGNLQPNKGESTGLNLSVVFEDRQGV